MGSEVPTFDELDKTVEVLTRGRTRPTLDLPRTLAAPYSKRRAWLIGGGRSDALQLLWKLGGPRMGVFGHAAFAATRGTRLRRPEASQSNSESRSRAS